MNLDRGQINSLIVESRSWRNQEAYNGLKRLREESRNPSLLDDVLMAYRVVESKGGWRASEETIKKYYNSIDRFIDSNITI